jgi:hypothetical protein
MRATLDRGMVTAAILTRFVSTLSPDEERTLARLLDPDRGSGMVGRR